MGALTELVIISMFTTIVWEIIRTFTWAQIPARLAPVIVPVIAILLTCTIHFSVPIGFAAATGVAVIHRFIEASGIDPLDYSTIKWLRRARRKPPKPTRKYIPVL
jgi:hypothetical protein